MLLPINFLSEVTMVGKQRDTKKKFIVKCLFKGTTENYSGRLGTTTVYQTTVDLLVKVFMIKLSLILIHIRFINIRNER